MTQRSLVVAAALAAAAFLAAGPAFADCSEGHTMASKETPSTVSTTPPATVQAPKPAETTAEGEKTTEVRTAEAKPAVR